MPHCQKIFLTPLCEFHLVVELGSKSFQGFIGSCGNTSLLTAELVICMMERIKISPLRCVLFIKSKFQLIEYSQSLGFLFSFIKVGFKYGL